MICTSPPIWVYQVLVNAVSSVCEENIIDEGNTSLHQDRYGLDTAVNLKY